MVRRVERVGGAEIAEVGVVEGFDVEVGVVLELAGEGENAVAEGDIGGEGDGQNAAVLAGEVGPLETELIGGDLLDADGALPLAENEVVAAVGQRGVETERDTESGTALDGPAGGLALKPGERAETGSNAATADRLQGRLRQ